MRFGLLDISFLPQGPNTLLPGIVIVLGTRPDDTLAPMHIPDPHQEYQIPSLSRSDFDLLLQRRQVKSSLLQGQLLGDRFYEAVGKNTLYLDLVAKELAQRETLSEAQIDEFIALLNENLENIFGFSLDRLRQPETQWKRVAKPLLILLLLTEQRVTLPSPAQTITKYREIEHYRWR